MACDSRPIPRGTSRFARHPHIPTESGGTIWWACVVYACMSEKPTSGEDIGELVKFAAFLGRLDEMDQAEAYRDVYGEEP